MDLLNSIGDGVLATDSQGRVTRWNAVAERLTDWTQAEALGRPVAEVFHIINAETCEPASLSREKGLGVQLQALLPGDSPTVGSNSQRHKITRGTEGRACARCATFGAIPDFLRWHAS